jgi:ubiquinone/menaquinone biosynthesis C-methylase UbiE
VSVQKRSHRIEKLARIYDDEIAPVWGTRFGRMILRNLTVPERGQVLDISCGTGWPTIEILRRMTDGSRLIAIDASSAMLDVARRKVADLGPLGKKGVYFRTESPIPKLSFADDVYDLVVCNLGLGEMPTTDTALRDFSRVVKRGGEIRCTLPLAGTFQEFHDIYREVLVKHDKHDAIDRLDRYIARYPTVDQCEKWMRDAGLVPGIDIEEFSLLFKSSREFFFAPVIEFGPLAEWKRIAGDGQEMQDVFWYIKEAIDAYFGGRAFSVTIKAGCLIGKKLVPLVVPQVARAELPNPPTPPPRTADGSVSVGNMDGLEVEELDAASPDFDFADAPVGEVALDAFVDGKQRPPHLDRRGPADTSPFDRLHELHDADTVGSDTDTDTEGD